MCRIIVLCLLVLLGAPRDLMAAASDWVVNEQASSRLVAARDSVAPDANRVLVGWQADLAPGWKTYWRAPGETGLPPRFDWSGSRNVAAVEIAWPVPERMEAYGFESIVYGDEVVLPITITLQDPGRPAYLSLKVDYMVCEEICLPLEARHDLNLPAGAGAITPHAALIRDHAARVPARQPALGERLEDGAPWLSAVNLSDRGIELAVRQGGTGIADIFLDTPPDVTLGRVRETGRDSDGVLRFLVPVHDDVSALPDRELGIVIVGANGQAIEWRGRVHLPDRQVSASGYTKAVDRGHENR